MSNVHGLLREILPLQLYSSPSIWKKTNGRFPCPIFYENKMCTPKDKHLYDPDWEQEAEIQADVSDSWQ